MKNNIFNNYEQFYTMVFSTTVMSNVYSKEYVEDMAKIIEFIGKAWKSDDAFVSYCKEVILGEEMLSISSLEDHQAMHVIARETFGSAVENQNVLEVKCDVISELHAFAGKMERNLNGDWFDFSQAILYEPHTRFHKIMTSAAPGHLVFTRQTGLLYALGIGCEKNLPKAIYRLAQCVAWGDVPSMYMLAHAYELADDKENSALMYEVAELATKYLNEGRTIVPKEDREKYSEKAITYYVFICSIKQDIVYGVGVERIDFSFVEAMATANIDNYARMGYINNYQRKDWKELTNSSVKPNKPVGFVYNL